MRKGNEKFQARTKLLCGVCCAIHARSFCARHPRETRVSEKSLQLIYGRYGIMRKEYIYIHTFPGPLLCALWRPKNLLRALHQNMLLLFIDCVKRFFMYFNVLARAGCVAAAPFLCRCECVLRNYGAA
jgi:hypothetical protein